VVVGVLEMDVVHTPSSCEVRLGEEGMSTEYQAAEVEVCRYCYGPRTL
jgi:hypothetical protein